MSEGTSTRPLGGDNAACSRGDCPRRETCRRYTGKRAKYQVRVCFDPRGCEYYWPAVESAAAPSRDPPGG